MNKKRYQKQLQFDKDTLKKLIDEQHTSVVLERCNHHLTLSPYHLSSLNKSINEILSLEFGKYSQTFKGILLGYENVKILNQHAALYSDSYYIHTDIEADFYVFQPKPGDILNGVVKRKFENQLGCLVHNLFNIAILKPEDEEDWLGKRAKLQQEIQLEVTFVELDTKPPHIRGSLLSITSEDSGISTSEEAPQKNKITKFDYDSDGSVTNIETPKKKIKKKKRNLSESIEEESAALNISPTKKKSKKKHRKDEEMDVESNISENVEEESATNTTSPTKKKSKKKRRREEEMEIEGGNISENLGEESAGLNSSPTEKKRKKKHRRDEEIEVGDTISENVENESATDRISPTKKKSKKEHRVDEEIEVEENLKDKKKVKKKVKELKEDYVDTLDKLNTFICNGDVDSINIKKEKSSKKEKKAKKEKKVKEKEEKEKFNESIADLNLDGLFADGDEPIVVKPSDTSLTKRKHRNSTSHDIDWNNKEIDLPPVDSDLEHIINLKPKKVKKKRKAEDDLDDNPKPKKMKKEKV